MKNAPYDTHCDGEAWVEMLDEFQRYWIILDSRVERREESRVRMEVHVCAPNKLRRTA